jgi:flagellar basal-body rod protein FlgB
MLGSMTDSTTVGLLEKLAIFGERRQEILAGNVANIDTPGYKPRDLPVSEFQQALKRRDRRTSHAPFVKHGADIAFKFQRAFSAVVPGRDVSSHRNPRP